MVQLGQTQTMNHSLRQEQTMSQQQIIAVNLLAAPVLELQSLITAEMEKNPVLELELPEQEVSVEQQEDEWVDSVMKLEGDQRSDPISYNSPEEDAQRKHFMDSISSRPVLEEGLTDQLHMMNLDQNLLECCEQVIAELDQDAYLTIHPAELSMIVDMDEKIISKAIKIVQTMEPPGAACKDLRERLLVQLEEKERKGSVAWLVVKGYLDDLAANHLPVIVRKLKITMEQLQQAIEEIRGLRPQLVSVDVNPMEYVKAEVRVEEVNDELVVSLIDNYLPSIRISAHYRKLLESSDTPKETKQYVRDKLRSAAFLINSLSDRQGTLLKITKEIVRRQDGFFRYGFSHMEPMTMSQVADEVGFHETTVSRAVSAKFVDCKFGLQPLRQFFTSSVSSEDGEAISSAAIKMAIRQLVDNENPKKPLSDSKLEALLKEQGNNVARRTIAKYRESLNIASSNLRRQH